MTDGRSTEGTSDPVDQAIAALCAGLDDEAGDTLARLVRAGVERLDTTAPPEFIAREEIAPAAELAPGERLDWAREFALRPVIARLNSRAWQLATALAEQSRPVDELTADAEMLLTELEAVAVDDLSDERRQRLLRLRNEAIADVRWVMSRGTGPSSLRLGRYQSKH